MRDRMFYNPVNLFIIATSIVLSGCTSSPVGTSSATINSKATNTGSPQTALGRPRQNIRNGLQQSSMAQVKFPLDCTVPMLLPAKFTIRKERLVVSEAAPELTSIPTVIGWGIKRIQTAPARFTEETVAAQYLEVVEKVHVLRERTELKSIPAIYKTLQRPVTIVPAHTRWKKGCVSAKSPERCFENVSATTRTLQQKIIDTPNRIIQQRIPPKTIEVTKKVLIKPGVGSEPIIPPQYTDVKVGKVRSVWQLISKPSAPRSETLDIQVKAREEQIKTTAVVCDDTDAATPELIKQIQQRLRQQGYSVSLSGKLDNASRRALTKFQQDKGLFIGGISAETLGRLGLK